MAERYVQNRTLIKTNNGYTALQNATEIIIIVGRGNVGGGVRIGMSLVIPVNSITSENQYFVVGDKYSTGSQYHLQVAVSKTAYADLALYKDANAVEGATYEWYYI